MKINKLSAIAFVAVAALSSTSFAMDPEFATLSKARDNGLKYKAAVAAHVPAHASLARLGGTDTAELLKAIGGTYADYIIYAKAILAPTMEAFCDGLGGADGTIVMDVGTAIGDKTRLGFKTVMLAAVADLNSASLTDVAAGAGGAAVLVPANAGLNILVDAKANSIAKLKRVLGDALDVVTGGGALEANDAGLATTALTANGGAQDRAAIRILLNAVVDALD